MFPSSKRPNPFEMPPQSEKRQQTATNRTITTEFSPQSAPVGQNITLPSFAEFIKYVSVPHVDHLQRLPEATWLPRPLLRQAVPSLCIQQNSQRPPAASSFQGSIPSVTTTSSVGLKNIAQELTSASGLSPTSQSATDAPADRLVQTLTPPAPEPTTSASAKPRKSLRRVNLETGEKVPEGTAGAIPTSTFYSRKLVDPKTGKPASKTTEGPITVATFNNNKLVDPKTGKPASKDTEGPITVAAFKQRKLVDPKTGKPASKDTESPITLTNFNNRKLVDPKTGKLATKDTEGPISAAAFKLRKRNLKN
jgi:hypothetical protein